MTLQQLKCARYPQYYISQTKLQTLFAAFIVLGKPFRKKPTRSCQKICRLLSTFYDF